MGHCIIQPAAIALSGSLLLPILLFYVLYSLSMDWDELVDLNYMSYDYTNTDHESVSLMRPVGNILVAYYVIRVIEMLLVWLLAIRIVRFHHSNRGEYNDDAVKVGWRWGLFFRVPVVHIGGERVGPCV